MQNMIAAFRKVVFKNYVTFSGRASRREFWWYVLAVILLNIAAEIVDAILGSILLGSIDDFGLVAPLLSLALILPGLAVGARRLHDTGRSGWWQLLWLLPVIGFFVLLFFFCRPSEPQENRFGPTPPPAPAI